MTKATFIPLTSHIEYPAEEMLKKAISFNQMVQRRRTIREFSDRPIPIELIKQAIQAAGSAPNGANLQPWHFAVVQDPAIKKKIRIAAEEEEKEFYERRATPEWLDALAALGTDEHKPFLEIAPILIAIFAQPYSLLPDGRKMKHYYAQESVGIATGILITALHQAGLATLTHTPSPMKFLNQLLNRPEYERPFLLLVVGHPASNAEIPDIKRKPLSEISSFL